MKPETEDGLYDEENTGDIKATAYENTDSSDIPMNMTSEDYH